MQSILEAAGGEAGVRALARAWHTRVLVDDVVSHAFADGFREDHEERLAAYWIQALGGPAAYTGRYGDESFVVREHSGNGPHEEMNRRAITCFTAAMNDVGLHREDPIWTSLRDWFTWATGFVNRYERSAEDVPDGLAPPRWTWEGPVWL